MNTGYRLGFVSDAVFDLESGQMRALIVPGQYKILGLFGRGEDYVIPWNAIRRIGDDIILVEEDRPEAREKKPRGKYGHEAQYK